MKKNKIKFYLSLLFLISSIIIVFFFKEYIEIIEKILIPLFFLYFVLDSLNVLFPVFNKSLYSGKHLNKFYIENKNYNTIQLSKKIRVQNLRSLLIFFIYFLGLTILGLLYIKYEFFKPEYIYIIFFAINFGDYFCILIWCPFRSLILHNKCCNTCRITNWDRLMKFYILIFIPDFYSITLVILGVIIFISWEYEHYNNPERFYSISNKALSCKMCDNVFKCKKNKE